MKPYWFEATYLLETLVMKAFGLDDNGMDLYFTAGTYKVENQKGKSKFKQAMNNKSFKPVQHFNTDMRASLSIILDKYLREYRRTRKNLTIIVLTDGKWEGMVDKTEVRNLIIKFAEESKGVIGGLKHRPVSIEFIQFGNDADATYRLRQLDDNLKWDGIELVSPLRCDCQYRTNEDNHSDIIDTEPSNGDINKMLLGSFVEKYDQEDVVEEEEEVEVESPVLQRGNSNRSRPANRPVRSSTAGTVLDATPRTIPQVMGPFHGSPPNEDKAPSRGHSRQNTAEAPINPTSVPPLHPYNHR
jgi:hypothetical protein